MRRLKGRVKEAAKHVYFNKWLPFRNRYVLRYSWLYALLWWYLKKRDDLVDTPQKPAYVIATSEGGWSFGDHFLICGIAEEIQRQHSINLYIYLARKQAIIAELYADNPAVHTRLYRFDGVLGNHAKYRSRGGTALTYSFFMARYFAPDPRLAKVFYNCLRSKQEEQDEGFCPERGENMMQAYAKTFGLPIGTKSQSPKNPYIEIDKDLKQKVEELAGCGLDKIVMINPFSNSARVGANEKTRESCQKLLGVLNQNGYKVLSNVMSEDLALEGSIFLPLTQREAYTLALKCHSIITLRSGFSDLLHQQSKLLVLYFCQDDFDYYNLSSIFTEARAKELVFDEASFIADAMKFVDGLNKNEAS